MPEPPEPPLDVFEFVPPPPPPPPVFAEPSLPVEFAPPAPPPPVPPAPAPVVEL